MKKVTMMIALLASVLASMHIDAHADDVLKQAIAGPHRTPAFVARDVWRHPYETLTFFGVRPDSTVVELSPGGGWYTEILAPYLRDKGRLILAADDPNAAEPEAVQSVAKLKAKLGAQPLLYDRVVLRVLAPPQKLDYAEPDSADFVLTFRNVHNWIEVGEDGVRAVFASAYRSLKPGGVFGVVEHRLPANRVQDAAASTGYVHQNFVIRAAQAVGFVLDATSEINANPKDTADHTGGVWALPPSYDNKEVNRSAYQAIGESDRMTLRFVKR
jgi:predicted methyltransferase